MKPPRIIKKYPNRRLYDTEESRYVTLADVQQLVRGGTDIQVLDSQSGEDITRSILIQIITDQETGKDPLFSTEMLTRFIRFYDDAVHDAFSGYLEQSMKFFADQQQHFSRQMQEAISGKGAWDVAEMTRRNLEFWQDMQGEFLKAAGLGGAPKDKSGGK
ncbi:polyhydroxyalkanoate synthesis repressor PhaR [Thioalkalivibrio sulfidiphilus]|uniref:polyhydroxyalkanoate synthesis repressor PhaR n=1 Tax=Thioalkalivibrio sulfidiphilus TaxID=1033854 RepID=UPI00037C45BA|nr:polyhydroxyalkanoate synthesis repressor PhaR [Thioalkalivibrio sulfidiphilus]